MAAFLIWVLFSSIILLFPCSCNSSYLTDSQSQALLDLKLMLENPPQLESWNRQTDFCSLSPTAAVTIVCENGFVTHLQIVGDRASPSFSTGSHGGILSSGFSSEGLMLQLSNFTNLKTLQLTSLGLWGPLSSKLGRLSNLQFLNLSSNFLTGVLPNRLMSLKNLQILLLDDNLLNASLPLQWDGLPSLATLSLSNNKLVGTIPPSVFIISGLKTLVLDNNLLYGEIPESLSGAYALQALSLLGNSLSGNVPDLRGLTNLLALNIQNNRIGPHFPLLSSQLLYLAMGKNKLQGPIPSYVQTFTQMQQLDLSLNMLSGVPPASLFSLPSLKYLDVARNRLSGSLPANVSLPSSLKMLDLSYNLLTGRVPASLIVSAASSSFRAGVRIKIEGNCLSTNIQPQNPFAYCQNAALASGLTPHLLTTSSSHRNHNIIVLVGIAGGVLGICLACLILLLVIVRRIRSGRSSNSMKGSPCLGNRSDVAVSSELLSNARYISRTMKLGALGSPQFREFSMEELFKATNYFHESTLLGEGSHGKVYKGQLEDGSLVAIKRLNKDQLKGLSNLRARLELLGKFRHQHLVSLLGYNITSEEGAQAGVQLSLVSEYVSNRTLRTRLAGKGQDGFGWLQRLLVLIGAAKGVHFLHYGSVPGIFDNEIKSTNILLDQSLVPKISDYGLAYANNDNCDRKFRNANGTNIADKHRKKQVDKQDVYNYGLVLLEVLIGRPPTVDGKGGWKELGAIVGEQGPRVEFMDPRFVGTCNMESLTTVVEITENCLSEDPMSRPSMEDVLWNLQYALQVQGSTSNGGSQEEFVDGGNLFGEPANNRLSGEQGKGKKGSRRNSLRDSKASSEEASKPSSPISDFFR